jgi:hypothetical protein
VWLEGLGKLKKSTSSETRTSDFPGYSIVPQPTRLLHAPASKREFSVFHAYSIIHMATCNEIFALQETVPAKVNTSPLVRISVWLPMICNLEYVVITG